MHSILLIGSCRRRVAVEEATTTAKTLGAVDDGQQLRLHIAKEGPIPWLLAETLGHQGNKSIHLQGVPACDSPLDSDVIGCGSFQRTHAQQPSTARHGPHGKHLNGLQPMERRLSAAEHLRNTAVAAATRH
jgi:hypothetical protein